MKFNVGDFLGYEDSVSSEDYEKFLRETGRQNLTVVTDNTKDTKYFSPCAACGGKENENSNYCKSCCGEGDRLGLFVASLYEEESTLDDLFDEEEVEYELGNFYNEDF